MGRRRSEGHLADVQTFLCCSSPPTPWPLDYIIDTELETRSPSDLDAPRAESYVYPLLAVTQRRGLASEGVSRQQSCARATPEGRFQSYSLADAIGASSDAAGRDSRTRSRTRSPQRGAAAATSELRTLPLGVSGIRAQGPDRCPAQRSNGSRLEGCRETASIVDITGLPETGRERLVGRDAEPTRRGQAWSDRQHQHSLARRRGRRRQVGSGQRMA